LTRPRWPTRVHRWPSFALSATPCHSCGGGEERDLPGNFSGLIEDRGILDGNCGGGVNFPGAKLVELQVGFFQGAFERGVLFGLARVPGVQGEAVTPMGFMILITVAVTVVRPAQDPEFIEWAGGVALVSAGPVSPSLPRSLNSKVQYLKDIGINLPVGLKSGGRALEAINPDRGGASFEFVGKTHRLHGAKSSTQTSTH